MDSRYRIERMSAEEVSLAVEWAAREGWNPGLHDAQCFYQADPNGFFAGRLDGKIIAVGSAVVYDAEYAFCGFYIVHPGYRDQGYGLELTRARLAYVGERNAGIDGVMNMLDKYARIGYRFAHNNARYQGIQAPEYTPESSIKPLADIAFAKVAYYDSHHFPAAREPFLRCWINQPDSLSLGWLEAGELKGYGVIRPCREGFKIGPLFADRPAIAEALFCALTQHAGGQPYSIDIPMNNLHAVELVEKHGLNQVFETARMYLKGMPALAHEQIYGITSFELG